MGNELNIVYMYVLMLSMSIFACWWGNQIERKIWKMQERMETEGNKRSDSEIIIEKKTNKQVRNYRCICCLSPRTSFRAF